MKVLITGGAGFLGSHMVDACKEKGWDVICLDSLDPGVYHQAPDYLRDDVDYCFTDLRTWTPDERFDDVTAILHLAALGGVTRAGREPTNVISANVVGTARLVEFALNCSSLKNIILMSSFSVYGSNYQYRCPDGSVIGADREVANLESGQFEVLCPNTGEPAELIPVTEDTQPNPLEAYGASKFMQELAFRGHQNLPLTIFRCSSIYGPRLRVDDGEATIIAKLAGWIAAGVQPKLYEDGKQLRDWVCFEDVVSAAVAILEGREAPPLINICSGVPTSLMQACEMIADAFGVSCQAEVVGGYRIGDMRHCLGDATRLTELLRRPPISFEQGVAYLK